ncbi:alpha-L-rhamnosidase rgxB [Aspergillus lentulus]|uniref:Alpha-L-rhamnosidase rgxB n=1 Tax=Aspergillus lentulus TaxID=293939 RepID=A0AAN4PG04_ASPLE|nr:alpha-L-rhamnosidase rgxB [Aspergillus lentulus]
MYLANILPFVLLPLAAIADVTTGRSHRRTCIVKPGGSESIDDTPAILKAFHECGKGGRVVFQNTTYHVKSVMNTSELHNCDIDLYGTLLWGTNISYWLSHSLDVGYQNQSTAWVIGGKNIRFDGHGYGTLNGNGQVWYDYVKSVSNYPRRPHALTVARASNSVFQGLRFLQSQMWTLSVIHSNHILFDSIYVNSTTTNGNSAHNTDGADTIYSSHITFNNWTVVNGDDSISTKANSTDILITNSVFYRGLGIAIGSIGQYKDVFETIERVRAENITYYGTLHSLYFKTWTGEQVNYPPNGGGGGLGCNHPLPFPPFLNVWASLLTNAVTIGASDISASNLHAYNLRGAPFTISQCTTFARAPSNCTSSKFQIWDLRIEDVTGSSKTDVVASFQCSAVKPCTDIQIRNVNLQLSNGTMADEYLCGNVEGTRGFNCTGKACEKPSSTGGC